jgi:hypothetical protein
MSKFASKVATAKTEIATVSNVTATKGQAFAASALFSAVDPDTGDAVVQYQLWDSTTDPTSGYFVAQGANQAINVSAALLGQTAFQSGSGADTLWVRATDGQLWSAWQSFTVSAPIDHAPVVGGGNASLTLGQTVQASTLFTVSDPDQGDTIAAYQFWESTSNPQGGHFALNGAAQGYNQAINVAAAQLNQATFTAGTGAGSDQLWVRASDGVLWSDWHPLTATSHA